MTLLRVGFALITTTAAQEPEHDDEEGEPQDQAENDGPGGGQASIRVVAGYQLGESWHVVEDYAGIFQRVVIVAVVLGAAWFVVSRLRRLRRDRSA